MGILQKAAWIGLLAAALPAQTVINGGRSITGPWDASQSVASKPAKMGAALPAACGIGEFFYLTSVAAGSNLYLCTSTNPWTAAAGTGGGAGPVPHTGGPIASAPACSSANAGTVYYGDDSPYETWCNGVSWKYRFNGAAATPANDAVFTWLNQGTASTASSGGIPGTGGVVGITAPGGGSVFTPRLRVASNAAAAFTITAILAPMGLTTAGNTQGIIGIAAASNAHLMTNEFRLSGIPASALLQEAVYNVAFPSPFQITTPTVKLQWFMGTPLWLRLQTPDSITFNSLVSTDHGANWQPMGTIVLGAAEQFTQLGWFVSSDSSDRPITGSLLSWQVTTP